MTTPLESLAEALLDCRKYASGAEAPPEAIVWCDPGGEFAPIMPVLRARLPHLLTFGTYDAATRTGPALWLRAAAARQVPGMEWPQGEPAVIYLPGYGRDVLRGAEDCPATLRRWCGLPSQASSSANRNRRGTGRCAGSCRRREVQSGLMCRRTKPRARRCPVPPPAYSLNRRDLLKGRRLDAAALDGLLVPDPILDMLRWIDGTLTPQSDPDAVRRVRLACHEEAGSRSSQEIAAGRRRPAWQAREEMGRGMGPV